MVGAKDLEFGSEWDGDSIYVVAVLIIQHEEVFVAGDGCDGQSTCLITVYCASDGFTGCVYVVGTVDWGSYTRGYLRDCINGKCILAPCFCLSWNAD